MSETRRWHVQLQVGPHISELGKKIACILTQCKHIFVFADILSFPILHIMANMMLCELFLSWYKVYSLKSSVGILLATHDYIMADTYAEQYQPD